MNRRRVALICTIIIFVNILVACNSSDEFIQPAEDVQNNQNGFYGNPEPTLPQGETPENENYLIANTTRLRALYTDRRNAIEWRPYLDINGNGGHIYGTSHDILTLSLGKPIEALNPILIGRNVVFSESWLELVDGETVTEEHLKMFIEYADTMYEHMAYFVGALPAQGERTVVTNVNSADNFYYEFLRGAGAYANGANHIMLSNYLSWNQQRLAAVAPNLVCRIFAHEIGHSFGCSSIDNPLGTLLEPENFANLLAAYVQDSIEGLTFSYWEGLDYYDDSNLNNFRELSFEIALQAYRNEDIGLFDNIYGDYRHSAFAFYSFGLVEIVGWDVYRLVFLSFIDPNFERNCLMPTDIWAAWGNSFTTLENGTKEFFTRIGLFYGDMSVLLSLPDEGELIQRFFPEEYELLRSRIAG